MKALKLTVLLFVIFSTASYSQNYWLANGSNIYYSGGNVGIGTTSPNSKLEVQGSVYLPSGQSYWIGSTIDAGNRLRLHHNGTDAYIDFATNLHFRSNSTILSMFFSSNGNIGIGTETPANKLDVNGTIRAKEIRVETGWADYVFAKDYQLPSLYEVKLYIEEHKHLPGIPAEQEVKEIGVNLGDMQAKLLQKIEELTLYTIQQQEMIEKLNARIEQLEKK